MSVVENEIKAMFDQINGPDGGLFGSKYAADMAWYEMNAMVREANRREAAERKAIAQAKRARLADSRRDKAERARREAAVAVCATCFCAHRGEC